MSFILGDRLTPISNMLYEGGRYSGEATLIHISSGTIGIEFDESFSGGHDCNGRGKDGYCWFVSKSAVDRYFYKSGEQEKYLINKWNYRPSSFTKYGNTSIDKYFGLEIEMDCGGESSEKCNEILSLINSKDEIAYAVYDGSIDDGFEVVLQPCTLNYLSRSEELKMGLLKAIELGYRGDVETCGLHAHIDRRAFGKDGYEIEKNISKLVYLFEKHWGEIVAISRRRDFNRVERYAKRYMYKYNMSDNLQDGMIYNKRELEYSDSDNRYFAINLQNEETVEIRIFKGTLNADSIIGIVQLINRLINVSSYSIEKVRRMSFCSIIAPLTKKDEFGIYLKRAISNGHFRMFPEVEELAKLC